MANRGRLIYKPNGAAKEYGMWACNLYNGCSNKCAYCYNRTGIPAKLLGKSDVTLKKGLTFGTALKLFQKELDEFKTQIKLDSNELFFNFVSDPGLPDSLPLNWVCMLWAMEHDVPCRMLTKMAGVAPYVIEHSSYGCEDLVKSSFYVGFTLTGMDSMEHNASTNQERLEAMEQLVNNGFRVWASIEPIIDLRASQEMITKAYNAGCRDFRIGLVSHMTRPYTPQQVLHFKESIEDEFHGALLTWKDSVKEYIGKIV